MKRPKVTRFSIWIASLLLSFCNTAIGETAFVPHKTDPILEKWRWQKLEIAENQNVRTLAIAPDDSIWMVFNEHQLVHYDGQTLKQNNFDWNDQFQTINLLFVSTSNRLYLCTNNGLFTLIENSWARISDKTSTYNQTAPLIQLKNGTIAFCHTNGISIIRDTTVIQEVPVSGGTLSACDDSESKLWVLGTLRGDVFQVEIEDGYIAPPNKWKSVGKSSSLVNKSGNLLLDKKGLLWYIDSTQQNGIKAYDAITNEWISHDLRAYGSTNISTDIIETHDGKILVAGRNSLTAWNGEAWTVYKQPNYIASSGRPILNQSPNGFLYIVESSTHSYRIDYAGRNWEGYEGIHFQDEALDGSKWFISIDNHIVRQFPNGKWTQYGPEDGIITTPLRVKALSNGDVVCLGHENNSAALSIFSEPKWSKFVETDFAQSFTRKSIAEFDANSFLIGGQLSAAQNESTRGSILKFSKNGDQYRSEPFYPEKYVGSTHGIVTTKDGNVWTSDAEIKVLNQEKEIIKQQPPNWRRHWVESFEKSTNDTIWASVWAIGVYNYNTKDGWTLFGPETGLPTTKVSCVLPLKDGTVLASSGDGFYRYDGVNWTPYFNETINLARDRGTLRESRNGDIWINNTHSDWYFRLESPETLSPKTKNNDECSFFTLHHVPDLGMPDTIVKSESNVEKPLSTNNIAFHWQGLDTWSKTPSDHLYYSYRIDEQSWSPFSKTQTNQLSNLTRGEHVFEVRSRDGDFNIDPTPAAIRFVVTVPIWKQPWFYIVIASIALAILSPILLTIRLKIKHIAELDELRNRFFTNLSHELRTPLTLMMFSLERLLKKTQTPENHKEISLVNLNANRMLNLVEQLLDFRKTEQGKIKIHPQPIELVSFIKGLLAVFEVHASEKKQTITFESSHTTCSTQHDPDLLQKIVDNLVSNAIKYTPQTGHIHVKTSITTSDEGDQLLQIVVVDNGIGIKKSVIEHIFEPFYRENNDLSQKGSGIGLAMVNDLVEFLGGTISVVSPLNKSASNPGSRFTVNLPLTEQVLLNSSPVSTDTIENSQSSNRSQIQEDSAEDKPSPRADKGKVVLLVEDNVEILNQLEIELSEDYQIHTAMDGAAGFNKAIEVVPDIIIADVMMPKMDGYQLTKKLKTNLQTSHIPVILLTALQSHDHEEQGFESGADDYVSKPVSMQLLHLKIKNQLQTRYYLSEKVREKYELLPSSTPINNPDEDFMNLCVAVVEANIGNFEFDMDDFAEATHLSRSGLYRKFESISNVSPATFLKTQRLKFAARSILETNPPVSEIAYEVGFSDAANFARSFKQHFGCPPSKYQAIHSKKL